MKTSFGFPTCLTPILALGVSAGCTFGVRPDADSVVRQIVQMETPDAEVWLQSKGYRQLHSDYEGPRVAEGKCWEKFDPAFSTAVQLGLLAVHVCFDQQDNMIVLKRSHNSLDWRETYPNSGSRISTETQKRLIQ